MPSFTKVSNGNIAPCRFVTIATTAKDRVTQATAGSGSAGDPPYGISGTGTRNRPSSLANDDGFIAIAGENVLVWGNPEKDVFLELGGTVTAGDSLKSDANGKGLTTTTANDWIGAIAMESGVSGDLVRVQVVPQRLY